MRLIDADALLYTKQLEPMGNGQYEDTWIIHKDDIDNAPTIDAVPQEEVVEIKKNYIDEISGLLNRIDELTMFIEWLTEVVLDDEDWELNAVGYGEIIARKLRKLGLLEVKDGYYVRTPLVADRQTGEWIDANETDAPWNDGCQCSECGRWEFVKHNFCPNCGADMRDKENNDADQ